MRPCHEAMIREQRELNPFRVYYNALSMVVAAIDAITTCWVSLNIAGPKDQRPAHNRLGLDGAIKQAIFVGPAARQRAETCFKTRYGEIIREA